MNAGATPKPLPPGYTLMHEYGRDVNTLPGVEYSMWLGNDPAGVHVIYEDPQLLEVGRLVLRDAVGAAHLVLELDDDVPPALPPAIPGRTPWYAEPANAFRAVAAMPGVTGYAYEGTSRVVTFTTQTAQQAEHLAQLVRPELTGATVRFTATSAQPATASMALPHPAQGNPGRSDG